MGVYTNQSNWVSRRGVFLLLLILFHIVLIWGLKSGFAWKVVAAITPPIVADIINEVDKDEAPPPPPPQITPDAPPSTAIQNTTNRPTPPPAPVVASVPRTGLKPNPKATQPNVDEYYPPTSMRLGEEGTTKVKVCVGVNGRVSTSELAETSGFERLDEAAIKVAKLYRFNPATENGKPVEECASMPIRFTIKDK
jgi:periplasmic protein TonB